MQRIRVLQEGSSSPTVDLEGKVRGYLGTAVVIDNQFLDNQCARLVVVGNGAGLGSAIGNDGTSGAVVISGRVASHSQLGHGVGGGIHAQGILALERIGPVLQESDC